MDEDTSLWGGQTNYDGRDIGEVLANDYGIRPGYAPEQMYGYISPDDGGRRSSSSYSGYTYGNSYAGGTTGNAYGGWLSTNPLSGNNAFSGNQGSTGMSANNPNYDPKMGMKDHGSHNAGGHGSNGGSMWNLQALGDPDSGGGSATDKGGSAGTTSNYSGFNYQLPPFKQPGAPAPQQPDTRLGTQVGPGIREYNWGQGQPQDVSRYEMKQSPDSGLGGSFRNQFDTNDEGYNPRGSIRGQQYPQLDMRNGGQGTPPPFLTGGASDSRTPGYWDAHGDFLAGTGRSIDEMNKLYPRGLFPEAVDKGTGLASDYSDPKYGNYQPQGGTQRDLVGDADMQRIQQNHAQQRAGNYDPEFFQDSSVPPKPATPMQRAMIDNQDLRNAYWHGDDATRRSIMAGNYDSGGGGSSSGNPAAGTGLPDFLKPIDPPGLLGAMGRQTQLNRGDNLYSGTTIDRMFGHDQSQRNAALGFPDNGAGHQSEVSSNAGIRSGYTPADWRQQAHELLKNWNMGIADGATGPILQPQYAPQYPYPPGQHYPDPIQAGQIEALLQQLTGRPPAPWNLPNRDNIFGGY